MDAEIVRENNKSDLVIFKRETRERGGGELGRRHIDSGGRGGGLVCTLIRGDLVLTRAD